MVEVRLLYTRGALLHPGFRMRLPSHLSIATLLLLLPGPAFAGLQDKKTLIVEGQTLDAQGNPIPKVRVWVDGMRISQSTDHQGQFSLRLLLGTPNDLRHGPLRLSIQAERKGYRFRTPSGDDRLAIELGLEAASGGLGRCIARSNDQRFAASGVRVMGLDGETVGLMVVNFEGTKGETIRKAPWPTLDK